MIPRVVLQKGSGGNRFRHEMDTHILHCTEIDICTHVCILQVNKSVKFSIDDFGDCSRSWQAQIKGNILIFLALRLRTWNNINYGASRQLMYYFRRQQSREPTIVTARSKAWTVFARANTGIVGSNPIHGMDVCVRLFCVCVVLCVCSGLATGWSSVQGVLPTVYKNKGSPLWSSGQSFWLKIQSSRVLFPALPDSLEIGGLERGPLSLVKTIQVNEKIATPV
jgi:hypothetical protein